MIRGDFEESKIEATISNDAQDYYLKIRELSWGGSLGDLAGHCQISVCTGELAADLRFCFDTPELGIFVSELQQLYESLAGEVKLYARYEDSYILFRAESRGHIAIEGLLRSDHNNKLEFSLRFDQTYLRPFISNLEIMHAATKG